MFAVDLSGVRRVISGNGRITRLVMMFHLQACAGVCKRGQYALPGCRMRQGACPKAGRRTRPLGSYLSPGLWLCEVEPFVPMQCMRSDVVVYKYSLIQ